MVTAIRKIFITLLITTVFSLSAKERSLDLFAQAHSAFEQGDVDQAIEKYVAIPDKGPAVWYNLGNCYYQKNDHARAIVCWQRSLPGASWKQYGDVQHNINTVSQSLGIKKPDSLIDMLIDRAAHTVPIWFVQWLFIISWWLLFILFWYRQRIHFFYTMLSIALAFLILSGIIAWVQFKHTTQNRGIVVTKNLALHAGPNHGYHGLGNVAYADTVALLEHRDGWYKVAKNDATGWVWATGIEPIEPLS